MSDYCDRDMLKDLQTDPMFEFGFSVYTHGSEIQKEIARIAIELAEAGKVHLQKRFNGEYLVSLEPPEIINQKISDDYQRYFGIRKYDKAGKRIEHTMPVYTKRKRQAEVVGL